MTNRLRLVTERTPSEDGAIGPANYVAHAVRGGQPEGRGQTRHNRLAERMGAKGRQARFESWIPECESFHDNDSGERVAARASGNPFEHFRFHILPLQAFASTNPRIERSTDRAANLEFRAWRRAWGRLFADSDDHGPLGSRPTRSPDSHPHREARHFRLY